MHVVKPALELIPTPFYSQLVIVLTRKSLGEPVLVAHLTVLLTFVPSTPRMKTSLIMNNLPVAICSGLKIILLIDESAFQKFHQKFEIFIKTKIFEKL